VKILNFTQMTPIDDPITSITVHIMLIFMAVGMLFIICLLIKAIIEFITFEYEDFNDRIRDKNKRKAHKRQPH
jgi:hypothetical protein